MKTKITELFGIEHPIVMSGMTGISVPRLVAAVSNAGGLGILATAGLNMEGVREAIGQIREMTDKPFGANLPLIIPGTDQKAKILIEEKVPVINYTLGNGKGLVEAVHAYGGKLVATVTTHKHAVSAQKNGADALIVTGHEAAAHGGEATSLVLVPGIVDAVSIPVIAAGGFSDGRGLAAALALGAEGVAMGTRFMNTLESPAHDNMKRLSREKELYDTVYSERIDGLPCRALRTKGADKLIRSRLFLLTAIFRSREAARAFGFPWIKMAAGILLSGYQRSKQLARMANAFRPIQLSMETGDLNKGVFLMGQVTGNIRETLSVGQVVADIMAGAQRAKETVNSKL